MPLLKFVQRLHGTLRLKVKLLIMGYKALLDLESVCLCIPPWYHLKTFPLAHCAPTTLVFLLLIVSAFLPVHFTAHSAWKAFPQISCQLSLVLHPVQVSATFKREILDHQL